MIAVTPSARLAAAGLAALMSAGLALAGPGSAFPEAGAVRSSAKALYEAARQAEETLRASNTAMRDKSRWEAVARRYRSVVLSYPRSGYCDDALHYEGGVYRDAAERFDDRRLAVRAADAYRPPHSRVSGEPVGSRGALRTGPPLRRPPRRRGRGAARPRTAPEACPARRRDPDGGPPSWQGPGAGPTPAARSRAGRPAPTADSTPNPAPAGAAERPGDGARRTVRGEAAGAARRSPDDGEQHPPLGSGIHTPGW